MEETELVVLDTLMAMLDWNNRDEVQVAGIECAKEIQNIDVFLQPVHPGISKNVWDNCAKVLAGKSDHILQPYLSHLLLWLEDMNWPGAFIIMERLQHFSGEMLVDEFTRAVHLAMRGEQSEMWLDNLSGLLRNKALRLLLSPEVRDLLCNRYTDFWGSSADVLC